MLMPYILLLGSLVAVPSISVICTAISVDDGLLRIKMGVTVPSPSPILYNDWLNDIVTSVWG